MESITLSIPRDQHTQLRLAKGKIIGLCESKPNDEAKLIIHDQPQSRMSIERQNEVVRMCLMCKTTGNWNEFESLSETILLEQLGLDSENLWAKPITSELPPQNDLSDSGRKTKSMT